MKYLLILLLAGCSQSFYVSDARMTVKGKHIQIVKIGQEEKLKDTTLTGKIIYKK